MGAFDKIKFVKFGNIVSDIRREFESSETFNSSLSKLYIKYNPGVQNIQKFIKTAKSIFPSLNCGLTTLYLQNKLGGEIVNGKYKNQNHTFLMIEDTVIDITADQYKGPLIYIGALKQPWTKL